MPEGQGGSASFGAAWALAREPDQELQGLASILFRTAVAATGILAIVAVFGLCMAFVRHLHLLNWIVGRIVLLGTNGKHFRTSYKQLPGVNFAKPRKIANPPRITPPPEPCRAGGGVNCRLPVFRLRSWRGPSSRSSSWRKMWTSSWRTCSTCSRTCGRTRSKRSCARKRGSPP